MRNYWKRMVVAACVFAGATFLSGQRHATAAETVRINGSGSGLDMMKPLIVAYSKSHPEVTIDMEKPMGSSGAIKAILAGALDVVVTSKPLKPEEKAKGASLHEYGKSPLVVVTEKSVRKTNITTRELEEIYAGKAQFWPGGGTIRVVLRPEHDIDTKILRRLSPGMDNAMNIAQAHRGMLVAATDPESNEVVANTPGAIGASALTGVIVGKLPLNSFALNGVKASTKTLANGTYPLAKDLNFITMAKISPATMKLLEFIYSSQGRAIAEKAGVHITASGNFRK